MKDVTSRAFRCGALLLVSGCVAFSVARPSAPARTSFSFVLLGDRTGEAQPGVYAEDWREIAQRHPAFVVSVGDSIQGLNDDSAAAEWTQFFQMLAPYRRIPLYLAPGNHDIWSDRSAELYARFSRHPPHYGFDYGPAHFTILDNSRSDQLPPEEIQFLEADLKSHAVQRLKFIVFHRPSWLIPVMLKNPNFPLHQLAKRYGVQYVVAGHIHQMLHLTLDGVTYLSLPSAGGHLRESKKYKEGWFFAYTLATVTPAGISFGVHELQAPYGEGRVTKLDNWSGPSFIETVEAAAKLLKR